LTKKSEIMIQDLTNWLWLISYLTRKHGYFKHLSWEGAHKRGTGPQSVRPNFRSKTRALATSCILLFTTESKKLCRF